MVEEESIPDEIDDEIERVFAEFAQPGTENKHEKDQSQHDDDGNSQTQITTSIDLVFRQPTNVNYELVYYSSDHQPKPMVEQDSSDPEPSIHENFTALLPDVDDYSTDDQFEAIVLPRVTSKLANAKLEDEEESEAQTERKLQHLEEASQEEKSNPSESFEVMDSLKLDEDAKQQEDDEEKEGNIAEILNVDAHKTTQEDTGEIQEELLKNVAVKEETVLNRHSADILDMPKETSGDVETVQAFEKIEETDGAQTEPIVEIQNAANVEESALQENQENDSFDNKQPAEPLACADSIQKPPKILQTVEDAEFVEFPQENQQIILAGDDQNDSMKEKPEIIEHSDQSPIIGISNEPWECEANSENNASMAAETSSEDFDSSTTVIHPSEIGNQQTESVKDKAEVQKDIESPQIPESKEESQSESKPQFEQENTPNTHSVPSIENSEAVIPVEKTELISQQDQSSLINDEEAKDRAQTADVESDEIKHQATAENETEASESAAEEAAFEEDSKENILLRNSADEDIQQTMEPRHSYSMKEKTPGGEAENSSTLEESENTTAEEKKSSDDRLEEPQKLDENVLHDENSTNDVNTDIELTILNENTADTCLRKTDDALDEVESSAEIQNNQEINKESCEEKVDEESPNKGDDQTEHVDKIEHTDSKKEDQEAPDVEHEEKQNLESVKEMPNMSNAEHNNPILDQWHSEGLTEDSQEKKSAIDEHENTIDVTETPVIPSCSENDEQLITEENAASSLLSKDDIDGESHVETESKPITTENPTNSADVVDEQDSAALESVVQNEPIGDTKISEDFETATSRKSSIAISETGHYLKQNDLEEQQTKEVDMQELTEQFKLHIDSQEPQPGVPEQISTAIDEHIDEIQKGDSRKSSIALSEVDLKQEKEEEGEGKLEVDLENLQDQFKLHLESQEPQPTEPRQISTAADEFGVVADSDEIEDSGSRKSSITISEVDSKNVEDNKEGEADEVDVEQLNDKFKRYLETQEPQPDEPQQISTVADGNTNDEGMIGFDDIEKSVSRKDLKQDDAEGNSKDIEETNVEELEKKMSDPLESHELREISTPADGCSEKCSLDSNETKKSESRKSSIAISEVGLKQNEAEKEGNTEVDNGQLQNEFKLCMESQEPQSDQPQQITSPVDEQEGNGNNDKVDSDAIDSTHSRKSSIAISETEIEPSLKQNDVENKEIEEEKKSDNQEMEYQFKLHLESQEPRPDEPRQVSTAADEVIEKLGMNKIDTDEVRKEDSRKSSIALSEVDWKQEEKAEEEGKLEVDLKNLQDQFKLHLESQEPQPAEPRQVSTTVDDHNERNVEQDREDQNLQSIIPSETTSKYNIEPLIENQLDDFKDSSTSSNFSSVVLTESMFDLQSIGRHSEHSLPSLELINEDASAENEPGEELELEKGTKKPEISGTMLKKEDECSEVSFTFLSVDSVNIEVLTIRNSKADLSNRRTSSEQSSDEDHQDPIQGVKSCIEEDVVLREKAIPTESAANSAVSDTDLEFRKKNESNETIHELKTVVEESVNAEDCTENSSDGTEMVGEKIEEPANKPLEATENISIPDQTNPTFVVEDEPDGGVTTNLVFHNETQETITSTLTPEFVPTEELTASEVEQDEEIAVLEKPQPLNEAQIPAKTFIEMETDIKKHDQTPVDSDGSRASEPDTIIENLQDDEVVVSKHIVENFEAEKIQDDKDSKQFDLEQKTPNDESKKEIGPSSGIEEELIEKTPEPNNIVENVELNQEEIPNEKSTENLLLDNEQDLKSDKEETRNYSDVNDLKKTEIDEDAISVNEVMELVVEVVTSQEPEDEFRETVELVESQTLHEVSQETSEVPVDEAETNIEVSEEPTLESSKISPIENQMEKSNVIIQINDELQGLPNLVELQNDGHPFNSDASLPEPGTIDNDDTEQFDRSPDQVGVWKDVDLISLKSLKSLVAEVGCSVEEEKSPELTQESEDYVENLVEKVIDEATQEVAAVRELPQNLIKTVIVTSELKVPTEDTVLTESEIGEMKGSTPEENISRATDALDELVSTTTNIVIANEVLENALKPLKLDIVEEPDDDIKTVQNSPEAPQDPVIETKELSKADDEKSECLDSIGDLSERTIQRFNSSFDDPTLARHDSFSSISSFGERQKFRTAIENIRQDLLPFQSSVSEYFESDSNQLVSNISMDSPSDLSPNAPLQGFENPANYFANVQQSAPAQPASNDGSIDSSGYEKVDAESLEELRGNVQDPMQQSVFGSLSNERLSSPSMSHDDVMEKDYFGHDSTTAKILESPIAEEARKLVQDAVESASDYAKGHTDTKDDIAKELDNVVESADDLKDEGVDLLGDFKDNVQDTLQKTTDGLSDFVSNAAEKTQEAVHDFVQDHQVSTPEPAKNVADNLVDFGHEVSQAAHDGVETIKQDVENVHNEVDDYLRDVHRQPSPPQESEEDHIGGRSDDVPHFGQQTPEEEEDTFNRKGPLTIPELPEKYDEFSDFDTVAATGQALGAQVGAAFNEFEDEEKFEAVPRPPTPPKDISDEPVQPSVVDLGPPRKHSHAHSSTPHHSILKNSPSSTPWVDFKSVDPRG
ncbi:unnamed protein product [Caenorhabditis bovis]|uniref:Reticulon-like protein n=1 Tax=Caenorhabditis bovis TaxID=2654633 RepID=A0A8S1EEQ1_9PELO|nr:unnamed protein product [Caenorhabditis bovis]